MFLFWFVETNQQQQTKKQTKRQSGIDPAGTVEMMSYASSDGLVWRDKRKQAKQTKTNRHTKTCERSNTTSGNQGSPQPGAPRSVTLLIELSTTKRGERPSAMTTPTAVLSYLLCSSCRPPGTSSMKLRSRY